MTNATEDKMLATVITSLSCKILPQIKEHVGSSNHKTSDLLTPVIVNTVIKKFP